MNRLFSHIRELVMADRYMVGDHAVEQLDARGILEWQVVVGTESGMLVIERPDAKPNPAVEVDVVLADGTTVKAVWAWLRQADIAKLVTVHFYDRD